MIHPVSMSVLASVPPLGAERDRARESAGERE